MKIIGESMHLINPLFLEALENKDEEAIVNMAQKQAAAGASGIDLNLGSSERLGALTEWLLTILLKETDLELFVSSHILKQMDLVERYGESITINAVTANLDELRLTMDALKDLSVGLTVLLVNREQTPADVDGRLNLAVQVLETAEKTGFPLSRIYLDPIISCRPDPTAMLLGGGIPDMKTVCESIHLIKALNTEVKSIAGISNTSVCLEPGKRSALHRRLLPLLAEAGLDLLICNCHDRQLVKLAKEISLETKDKTRISLGEEVTEGSESASSPLTVKGIAESINIMGSRSGTAMKNRVPGPVQEMAREQTEAGATYLDLNIGPARKDGTDLMPWVVESVESALDTPLCLDTTNTDAMIAGFKALQNKEAAIMNSISAQPERMKALIPVAAETGCNVIALLWGPDGMPRDSNERASMAVDLLTALNGAGIPNEKILFDPIGTPMTLGADQISSGLEFMMMLPDIAPGAGSTVGLSNVSNGVAEHLRKYLDRTYLIMLMKYGQTTAIVNSYDAELMAICQGERPELVELVHGMMDGNYPDPDTLTGTALEHYKTYRCLSGEAIFSESWLEL